MQAYRWIKSAPFFLRTWHKHRDNQYGPDEVMARLRRIYNKHINLMQ